jgi:hypothetical protein
VSPAGQWLQIEEQPLLARANVSAAAVRTEGFIVTGDPPVLMDGISISANPVEDAPPMAGTATATILNDTIYTIVVGEGSGQGGIVRLGPEGISEHNDAPSALRTGHGAVNNRQTEVIALGGAVAGVPTDRAIIARPVTNTYVEAPGAVATPRTGAAIGGNGSYAIMAGGRDASGTLLGDAEVFELETYARIGVIPMVVPRTGAVAASLSTGQILVIGGVDDAGAPIGTIEIFNPPVPADL